MSDVPPGRWVIVAGLHAAPVGAAPVGTPDGALAADEPAVVLVVELDAADAMPAAPILAPATKAPVTRVLRMMDDRGAIGESSLHVQRAFPDCTSTVAGEAVTQLGPRSELPQYLGR